MGAGQASTTPCDVPPLGRGLHELWSCTSPTQGQAGPKGTLEARADALAVDDPWDVIIIGTGYGGSMAAATLAALLDEAAIAFSQALRGPEAPQGLATFAARKAPPWSANS